MVAPAPKFGVRFLSRKERTVRRVTKYETKEIQKRLEPPKPPRVRPPPKPKAPKRPPPATLCKPPKPPRISSTHSHYRQPVARAPTSTGSSSKASDSSLASGRTLQLTDLEKLSRLNCSREFSLFHQFIKAELSKSYENQLGFLQTKLQHLKNEFVNKQAEHLNFEQIREYYNDAVAEHVRRRIKPDEYLTLADKYKQDSKQAIEKWLRKKEFKQVRQLTEFSQRRQARIRDRIKETIEEAKKMQQAAKDAGLESEPTESSISIPPATTTEAVSETTIVMREEEEEEEEEEIVMIID